MEDFSSGSRSRRAGCTHVLVLITRVMAWFSQSSCHLSRVAAVPDTSRSPADDDPTVVTALVCPRMYWHLPEVPASSPDTLLVLLRKSTLAILPSASPTYA